jgi:pilus assembly protein CpaB
MSSRIILPVVALVLAVAVALLARDMLRSSGDGPVAQAAPEPPRKHVLVAAAEVPPGSFLRPDLVRWQEWPDVAVPESYHVKGEAVEDEVVGSVARQYLPAGMPIVRGSIVRPGDRGFLAAVLGQGMRAISIPVDEASSNAGLIFPGDHVDVILTQSLRSGADQGDARRASETVVEDVRVLAMGRRLSTAGDEDPGAGQIRTATLEASPAGAERIALATELGRVSLSLRGIVSDPAGAAATDAEMQRLTWDFDVSRAIGGRPAEGTSVTVLRGDDGNERQTP